MSEELTGAFGNMSNMKLCYRGDVFRHFRLVDPSQTTHVVHVEKTREFLTVVEVIDGKLDFKTKRRLPNLTTSSYTHFLCFEPQNEQDINEIWKCLRILKNQNENVFVCVLKKVQQQNEQGFAWILPNVLFVRTIIVQNENWIHRCSDFFILTGICLQKKGTIAHVCGNINISTQDVQLFLNAQKPNDLPIFTQESLFPK